MIDRNRPLVSAIIPNYNYAQYLPTATESVLAQSYPHIEVIVVDDGSTDESEAVLRGYGERIRWIRQENQGVSAARNRGARESNGRFLAFLDPDDVWLPRKVELQVERFLRDPELGLVHCGVEEINQDGFPTRVRLKGLTGWVAEEILLFRRAVILGGGSGLMVPRAAFEAVGGFDPRLSTSADYDFCYRVSSRQRVDFIAEVLLQYRYHGSNMHSGIDRMARDMLLFYDKAFQNGDSDTRALRRRCYGNLHMTLAGSYFRAGKPLAFMRHAAKSLSLTPGNCARLLGFPLRRLAARFQKA